MMVCMAILMMHLQIAEELTSGETTQMKTMVHQNKNHKKATNRNKNAAAKCMNIFVLSENACFSYVVFVDFVGWSNPGP